MTALQMEMEAALVRMVIECVLAWLPAIASASAFLLETVCVREFLRATESEREFLLAIGSESAWLLVTESVSVFLLATGFGSVALLATSCGLVVLLATSCGSVALPAIASVPGGLQATVIALPVALVTARGPRTQGTEHAWALLPETAIVQWAILATASAS